MFGRCTSDFRSEFITDIVLSVFVFVTTEPDSLFPAVVFYIFALCFLIDGIVSWFRFFNSL